MATMSVFIPVYWMGWVIQPTSDGFWVSDRVDRSEDSSVFFKDFDSAQEHILSKLSGGDKRDD
jgi:hypothetical protein